MSDETRQISETTEMSTVLRNLWAGEGSSREELEEVCGNGKTCRNMKHVNFDAMAGSGADLAEAWRDKLRREGKLAPGATSLGALILGGEASGVESRWPSPAPSRS